MIQSVNGPMGVMNLDQLKIIIKRRFVNIGKKED
jgi:hypothetical protein